MSARNHTRPVPERARELAAELEHQFAGDVELAKRLNDAHQRLQVANDRLWSGLQPDGLEAVYGQHPAFETIELEAAFHSRSEVLESGDPLAALQEAHWQIRKAHNDYQEIAEDRRHLAAEIGELIARFVDALMTAGWSEEEARNADVRDVARGGQS